jgi:hypothetical protein
MICLNHLHRTSLIIQFTCLNDSDLFREDIKLCTWEYLHEPSIEGEAGKIFRSTMVDLVNILTFEILYIVNIQVVYIYIYALYTRAFA